MKKLTPLLLFVGLLLAGCGSSSQSSINQLSSGAIDQTSGENIITVDSITGSNLRTCNLERLQNITPLIMDDLVSNCTTRISTERFLDGLGGVTPEYMIAEGTIMMPSYGEEPQDAFVCTIGGATYLNQKNSQRDTEIAGYSAILRVIGKGLLDQINPRMYPDSMYCNSNDFECNNMIDFEGWSDGSGNYFVAGFRYQLEAQGNTYHTYYVINDVLYNPGSTQRGDGILTKSKRNFVNIKDHKIIVQRFINGHLPAGIDLSDPKLDPTTIKSSVQIETCEIPLKS